MSNGAKATDLRCTETNLRKNRAFYEKRGTRTDASQDAASMHAPTARTASGAAASAAPSVRSSASGTAHMHSHTHADFASHGELPGGLSLQVEAQTRGTGSFAIYDLTIPRSLFHAFNRMHACMCLRVEPALASLRPAIAENRKGGSHFHISLPFASFLACERGMCRACGAVR